MRQPLFLGIGVHRAQSMPVLDGVLTSVDGMCDWADRQGYEVIPIVDNNNPVTVDSIRDRLTPLLDPQNYERDPSLLLDRPRIVVYFCGHGLHAAQDQYWILSPGPSQADERISANSFRDTLASYGPKQIAVISDACRTAQVHKGLARAVVPEHAALVGHVEKDNFLSSQDGASSFAFPSIGGAKAYCVFSSVLLRALSAPPEPDALDKLYLMLDREVVSSQSLSDYLRRKVPNAALAIGELQEPDCNPGFQPLDNWYVEFTTPAGPPGTKTLRVESAPDGLRKAASQAVQEERSNAQLRRIQRSRSEWRGPYIQELERMGRNIGHAQLLVLSRSDQNEISVWGRGDRYSGQQMTTFDTARTATHFDSVFADSFAASGRSSVVVAQVRDTFVPIPLHERLWCAAVIEAGPVDSGTELLTWGEESSGRAAMLSSAEALKGLSAGALNADDAVLLAAEIRNAKHVDPMYGIVSAYLYNAVGDVQNIRRMCYFYRSAGQDVPLDIALLAQLELRPGTGGGFHVEVPEVAETPVSQRPANWSNLPEFTWRATPVVTVGVAGVTPLLRAGWQYLEASQHPVHRACWELAGQLTASPVASLQGEEAGRALVDTLRKL